MFRIRIQRGASPWKATSALACFVSAVVAGIVGSLLTTGWILNARLHPWLYEAGFILLVLAIPTLILGGHCRDLLEPNGGHRARTVQIK